MKIKSFFLFSSLIFCFPLCAKENYPSITFDDDLFDDPVLDQSIKRSNDPSDILGLLFSLAQANKVLSHDLYCCTYPLPTRSILSYPSFANPVGQKSHAGFTVFYNQATNLFPCCSGIEGYMGLFDQNLLRDINNSIAKEHGVDLPKTLVLFKNARVEQRRVGFIFDFWKRIKWLSVGLELPLYAIERNYNLPLEDQQEIKSADIFESSDDNKVDESAFLKYTVETRLGLGDLRLTLGGHAWETDRYHVILGSKITFPTATTFAAGFIGSDFRKINKRCWLNLEDLVEKLVEGSTTEDSPEKEQAIEEVKDFGVCAINQLSTILLQSDLGESRFKLDLFVHPTFFLSDQVQLLLSAKVGWLLPKTVSRFILDSPCSESFADKYFDPTQFPPEDKEKNSEDAINFLNKRVQNVVFPPQYCVKLRHQMEGQLTAGALFECTDNWALTLGYDYWIKTCEQAKKTCPCNSNDAQFSQIQLNNALVSRVSQQKLFFRIEYIKFKASHNLNFSFGADFPLVSKGIGDDYSGFLKLEWNF